MVGITTGGINYGVVTGSWLIRPTRGRGHVAHVMHFGIRHLTINHVTDSADSAAVAKTEATTRGLLWLRRSNIYSVYTEDAAIVDMILNVITAKAAREHGMDAHDIMD